MRIPGKWHLCEDGVTRPMLFVTVHGATQEVTDYFLIDSGADRTVLAANLFEKLGLPPTAPASFRLEGVGGGGSPFVLVTTTLELECDDGSTATVRGGFAAFSDPAASDMSILGRDVLNNFNVIFSRPRNEILLLAGNHGYRVERS